MRKTKFPRVAYSFVMADLLHYGHIRLLKTAKEKSDYHICGLISDEACHIWQGMNISNYEERKGVLESLDCVDEIVLQETMDPTENLQEIHRRFPRAKIIMVHGNDWKALPASEYLQKIGGRIIQPEYYSRLSRQNIIKKFSETLKDHPLKHEFYTQHFRLGHIVQFNQQPVNGLISSKANTLKSFQSLLRKSQIEKLFIFTAGEFLRKPVPIIKAVMSNFSGKPIIVRSSSFNEDRYHVSNAGQYESVMGVSSGSHPQIRRAVEDIIRSYKDKGVWNPRDQILVQTQTTDIIRSGVVFTRNIETGAPYYLINYDDMTGQSDTVTSGNASKSIWLHREGGLDTYPSKWRNLMTAIYEIETYLPGMVLDIEFAERISGQVVIFQIRPLTASLASDGIEDETVHELIEKNRARFRALRGVTSNKPLTLSDMAFWNPAELIGENPHPLDYSLFREIITKSAWIKGLVPLGYSQVSGELMERFGNKPYIIVDHAFHALIPDTVDAKLKRKLCNFYLDKLKEDPAAHDKVEFEIVASCFSFDLDRQLTEMRQWGLSRGEVLKIQNAVKKLTQSIIKNSKTQLRRDLRHLKGLSRIREAIREKAKQTKDVFTLIELFIQLLAAISEYGTPQFSRVARQAFIARSLLKDFVTAGMFSQAQIDGFFENLTTVASDFERDFEALARGSLSKPRFLKMYGHLRTATYDIRAHRYDEMDMFDLPHSKKGRRKSAPKASLDLTRPKLERVMRKFSFPNVPAGDFHWFLRSSLEQREYFKFEFTKSLSLALVILTKAGEALGFSREDLSYLELHVIQSAGFCNSPIELQNLWGCYIETSKKNFHCNTKLVLPPILHQERDFRVIHFFSTRPNFVTQKTVEGELVNLEDDLTKDIEGKIVLLEKADPGFDWIFTKHIKGLITKYGGTASHMAIRCAEFSLPAVIGCGNNIYNKIRLWRRVKLDCGAKRIG